MATRADQLTDRQTRWLDRFPDMGTGPIPVERLLDPAYFELEREKIFKRAWLHVGRVEQIPEEGDWFVQEIAVARTSLIIVRGEDGDIRAFHNVCRHRGSKLAMQSKGSGAGMFACRFHGWTYNSEGTLVHVPQEEHYYEPLCGKKNLIPVACDIWEGFIFVNLQPEPAETLREFLGPAWDRFEGYPFDALTKEWNYRGDIKANWKVVMDSQAEGIHAPYVHTLPWPTLFTSPDSPFTRYLDIDFFGKHRTYTLAAGTAFQPSPVEALALSMGPAISASGEAAFASCKRLNPTGDPNWSFDCLALYPNMLIYCFGGVYHTHQFWPIDAATTTWDLRMHLPQATKASEVFSQEHAKVFLRDPFLEDGRLNEDSQQALESGAVDELYLQDDEALIRHCYWVAHNAVMADD